MFVHILQEFLSSLRTLEWSMPILQKKALRNYIICPSLEAKKQQRQIWNLGSWTPKLLLYSTITTTTTITPITATATTTTTTTTTSTVTTSTTAK